MHSELRLGPIGQIVRPLIDVARAVVWCRDVLGLTYLYTFGDLVFFDCGGVWLFLSADDSEGSRAKGAASEPSVLYFRVPDIQAAYTALIHKHEDGLKEWMAFFDDPDGCPLALMSQVGH